MAETKDIIKRFLGEALKNIAHSLYDEYVEANVRFRTRSGMKSLIIRRELSKCCDWCHNLAGIYEYGKEPKAVYQRHDSCRCMVTFRNEEGKYEDVWTKKEYETQRAARKERADIIKKEIYQEKQTVEVLIPYYEKSTPGKGKISQEQGYKKSEDKDANTYGYILHRKFGGNIVFRNRNNNKRKSDYIWNGKYWEHKHVSGLTSADNQTRSCVGQIEDKPGGLIIQLTAEAYDISMLDLEKTIRNRLDRTAAGHGIEKMDVLVFKEQEIVLAIKWTKK